MPNFLLEDRPQRDRPQQEKVAVAVGENIAAWTPKKVQFLENLSKVFPKTDGHFDEKLNYDDDQIDCDELSEISIPNTETLLKELNDGKITEELNIYYDNLNMRENIYGFVRAQQDETKNYQF